MTATPITLRVKSDDIPQNTQAADELRGLKPSILKHAEEIYKGEQKNGATDDNKFEENVLGTRTDSKGNTRHAGAAYDLLNWLGARPKVIQGLLNDEDRLRSFQQGPDSLGRYSGLNWIDRHIHKITDEDITKALHAREITARGDSASYQQDLRDLTPEQRKSVTNLTSVDEVRRLADEEREYEALETRVRGMDLGATSLDELVKRNNGDRISKKELEQLETDLKPLQTKEIRAAQNHESDLKTEQTNRDVATANQAETTRSNLASESLRADELYNNNALNMATIDFKNAQLQHETDVANAKLKYEYETANFDRELKRDLALLGIEDSRDERRYRSERDQAQDRQLFILQLMKGLSGLGQSFQ